jgi:hypothetical protein
VRVEQQAFSQERRHSAACLGLGIIRLQQAKGWSQSWQRVSRAHQTGLPLREL